MMDKPYHVPVLYKEVAELLITDFDGIYIDGGGDAAGNHESGIKVFNSIGSIIIKNCIIFNLGPSPINQKSEDNGDIQGIVVKRQVNRRGPTEVHISENRVYTVKMYLLGKGLEPFKIKVVLDEKRVTPPVDGVELIIRFPQ